MYEKTKMKLKKPRTARRHALRSQSASHSHRLATRSPQRPTRPSGPLGLPGSHRPQPNSPAPSG